MQTNGRYAQKSRDLFEQALERIPANSPEWTDFNQSDPGITLVQVFAWLAESLLYRDGQSPENQRKTFRRIAALARRRFRRPRLVIAGGSKSVRAAPARFLAGKLGLRLFRVDLSAVVSKYIGETEKNLRRILDEAEGGGAILYFDEADALFGKRSETKDSHDRFANLEAGRLLQTFEQFEGVAILAMERCAAVDLAFLRRSKWMVYFCEQSPRTVTAPSRNVFAPKRSGPEVKLT
jgi:SpoVK/Ycf46/Vps4 family AAA+-type ATPase